MFDFIMCVFKAGMIFLFIVKKALVHTEEHNNILEKTKFCFCFWGSGGSRFCLIDFHLYESNHV